MIKFSPREKKCFHLTMSGWEQFPYRKTVSLKQDHDPSLQYQNHSTKCEILTHFFIFTLIILKRIISGRMCSHLIDDKGSFTTCLFQILIFTAVFH